MQPWIWALLAGAVAVLHPDRTAFVMYLAHWIAVPFFTCGCIILYNRLDKRTRVLFYPLLQFARGAAFTVIVPITSAGVAALGAHVLSRWVMYHVYRPTSRHWPVARPELMRALVCAAVAADRLLFRPLRPAHVERIGIPAVECIQSTPRRLRSFQFRPTPRSILLPRNDQRRECDPASTCETPG
jgi:hypothetical protein